MKPLLILAIALASLTITSCSGKNNENAEANYTSTNGPAPVDYRNGPDAISPEQLNEMILFADDLGAGEATGALDYLRALAEESKGKAREVIMRKFVDLYGIALDNHGDELRGSMNQLKGRTGIDLRTIYEDYSATLRVGDNEGANPDEVITQKADSAEIKTTNGNEDAETSATESKDADDDAVITTSGE